MESMKELDASLAKHYCDASHDKDFFAKLHEVIKTLPQDQRTSLSELLHEKTPTPNPLVLTRRLVQHIRDVCEAGKKAPMHVVAGTMVAKPDDTAKQLHRQVPNVWSIIYKLGKHSLFNLTRYILKTKEGWPLTLRVLANSAVRGCSVHDQGCAGGLWILCLLVSTMDLSRFSHPAKSALKPFRFQCWTGLNMKETFNMIRKHQDAWEAGARAIVNKMPGIQVRKHAILQDVLERIRWMARKSVDKLEQGVLFGNRRERLRIY